VPARDRRTVGELLADSDALSREMLLDVSAKQGPAMVRTWGQVVQSAARLWAVLPPISVAAPSGPDLMVRLRVIGDGIARSTSAGGWPGLEPMDERLLEIARNLSRAADLVERYGQDVQPTSAETRADTTAARARVMHTLYVAAHGTAVALGEYANDLRDRLHLDTQRRRPVGLRPTVREREAAEAVLSRFGVFEASCGRIRGCSSSHCKRSWQSSPDSSNNTAPVRLVGVGHPGPPHACGAYGRR
jgi:hypothetical protein